MVQDMGTNMEKNLDKVVIRCAQNKWRRPELQRLAIAATANCQGSDKTVEGGNEGSGGGKGDCGVIS